MTPSSSLTSGPTASSRSVLPLPVYFDLMKPPHTRVLHHFVKKPIPKAPAALNDAVIVGLDAEWFERGTKDITELGFAILDTRDISSKASTWDILSYMRVYHLRLKKTAHMVNTAFCPGRPDKFQFGQTAFVDMDEARAALLAMFSHPKEDGTGNRPVILMGHAVDNDIDLMRKHFDVDLAALGTIVTILDTQVMAQEIHIPCEFPLISLKKLLAYFGIHEDFLHTAGNDIACTMIAALLMSRLDMTPAAFAQGTFDGPIEQLKLRALRSPPPPWGVLVFCTRCDSTDHMTDECKATVLCERCAAVPARTRLADTHKTEKCIVPERVERRSCIVIPCEHCNLCPDPKRWRKAITHVSEDCFYLKLLSLNIGGSTSWW